MGLAKGFRMGNLTFKATIQFKTGIQLVQNIQYNQGYTNIDKGGICGMR
jgi:hypothetical protein